MTNKKVSLGAIPVIYPEPAVLVGVNVNGQANFTTVAWAGVVASEPPMLMVALRPSRYSTKGVFEHQSFSVNIPSSDMAEAVDYCGMYSGSENNKAEICGFNIFHTKDNIPMIKQCPVNIVCRLKDVISQGSHYLICAQILDIHASSSVLASDGTIDVEKVNPLIFMSGQNGGYFALGRKVGEAFSCGKNVVAKAQK